MGNIAKTSTQFKTADNALQSLAQAAALPTLTGHQPTEPALLQQDSGRTQK